MDNQLSIWQEQKKPIVRMHNDLILAHFGKLDMGEMRIFLIMLAKVEWDSEKLKKVRVALRDIDPNIQISESNDHFKRAIAAADDLTEKMGNVRMQYREAGKRVYLKTAVIQSIKYVEGTDYLECTWGEEMAPFLLNLKGNFTSEELSELLKLKSTYAIRFYMIVKSLWRENQVLMIQINELRMMLLGDLTSYPEYKIFNREVLKKSMTALENTTCAFRIEEERKGRFVDSITIIPLRSQIDLKPFSKDVEELLRKYKVNDKKIRYMYSNGEISEDFIRFTFDMCFKVVQPSNKEVGGFIYEAIVNKKFEKEYTNRNRLGGSPVSISRGREKKEFISLEDLKEMHQKSLIRNPDSNPDLSGWIEEIFINEGFFKVQNEQGIWGVAKIKID